MNKIFTTTLLSILGIGAMAQNKFHMSQSMMYQPFINPAAIASYSDLNGALFYKSQWTGFAGAPEIGGFSANMPLGESNGHAGLQMVNDRIGISNVTDISGTYAYRIKITDENYIALGVSGSLVLMQSDLNALDVLQTEDPIFQANTPTFAMPNFKFGGYYFTHGFYVGLGVPNLLRNRIASQGQMAGMTTFDGSNVHYYFHTGYKHELNENFDVNTSVLLKQVSGAPLQIGLNGQLLWKKQLGFGLSYRTSKEIVGLLSYQITNELKLGYSYDFNMDDIGRYSNGTHEIMVLFQLDTHKKVPVIEVPRF